MKLDDRKKKILQAITIDYISTAEPVGSRTIARRYDLGISPATIRNEMSDLEEGGYIQQPHASSGRIPSDKGYRFYVDSLMSLKPLSEGDEIRIRDEYESKKRDIERVIGLTSKMLSSMTNYTSMVSGPRLSKTRFKHIQLIPIDINNILIVLVTDPGLVENRIVGTPIPFDAEELDRISAVLNKRLRGLSIDDLGPTILEEIKSEIVNQHFYDQAIELIYRSLEIKKRERVFMDGSSNFLSQPEFQDIDKARSLLGMLEREEQVLTLLEEAATSGGIQITIGQENKHTELKDCSMVTANYSIGGEIVGSIAVVGPTRMEYDKVVTVVRFMAESLSEILTRFNRGR